MNSYQRLKQKLAEANRTIKIFKDAITIVQAPPNMPLVGSNPHEIFLSAYSIQQNTIDYEAKKALTEWVAKNIDKELILKWIGENKNMEEKVQFLVNKTLSYGYANGLKSFINRLNELIVIPAVNAYFRLEDVKSELDFKCKVLNWLSFYCAPNHWYKNWSKKMCEYINYILETNFSKEDFEIIYGKLGNAIHKDLTIKFVESGYDMGVLK